MLQWCKEHKQTEVERIIIIGLNTGARIRNILSIQAGDVEDNYLRIWQNKANKPYSIPLNPVMRELMKDFKPFTLKYSQVYHIFTQLKKDLQLDDDISIHTLRHTFCSNLIQKGVALPVIQALANHRQIQTTMRYAHLCNKQLEEAINIL